MKHRRAIEEIYKPVRINFPRRRYEIRSIDDCIQIDLADMTWTAKENDGHRYFLLANNPFSKKIYVVALKTKSAKEVTKAMKIILERAGIKFKNMYSDRGTEFTNATFKKEIVDENGINHYLAYSSKKAAMAERSIGTVKRRLYKLMALRGTHRWIDIIDELVEEINNTKHSRYGFAPNEVTSNNEKEIYEAFYSLERPRGVPTYRVGENVRKSEPVTQFRRSFYPSWSPAIYKVAAINRKVPIVYKLKDYKGKLLPGTFYKEQLLKTRFPDYFLIEKIVAKRGNMRKVRWWGYEDPSHDTWIHKDKVYDVREDKQNKKSD